MVEWIAECASNHNQNLNRALELVDTAAAIGCQGVKFQLFRVDQLFAPEVLAKSETHRKRKDWELPLEFVPHIAARCAKRGIKFGCTPCYLRAVDELRPYVEFYKIASLDLLWFDLVNKCIDTGLPLMLSTGAATLDEVRSVIDNIYRSNRGRFVDVTALHCVSAYPTPVDQCNLAAMTAYSGTFAKVGWSDHSQSEAVIYRAVFHWRADIIELHMDLDGAGYEFGAHCWLPSEIASVIQNCKDGFVADGSGIKEPAGCEVGERMWRRADDGLRPRYTKREEFR